MTAWPRGDGEMAGCIRAFDWAATPLGPIAGWPQSLKTIVDLMLGSPSMMSLVWGETAIHLYNDGFTALLREHRTLALGRSAYETFARSRTVLEADIAAGMAGRSARLVGQRYPVLRHGRLEEAWFDVDYAPIRDEAGLVAGVLWTLKETTAQHLAEQALRTSEARHRLLIRSWAQAEWETDADGVVVADSPSWRAYTGQTLAEWLGYGWLDAIHPDDRAYAERQWREAVQARGLVDAEFRLRAPDGGWRWTNVRAAPVLDDGGTVEKWAGMNIDIDARKRAEAALRESDARLAQLADAAPVLIWETDEAGPTFVNSHYLGFVGVGFEEISGFGWARFIHPDDLDGYITTYRQAFTERRPYDYECRFLRADGQYRWHRTSGGPASPGRFIGSSTDIHDLVMAERALREREERLRGVLDGMTEGFGLLGPDFTILEHNAEALRMDGRSREDIIGRSHWDVYPESENSELGRLLKRAMIERVSVSLEHHYSWENGRALWLDMRAYPTLDGALAVFWRDVTDRRMAELALKKSEAKYRSLFESMDEAYAVVEVLKDGAGAWVDFRFIEVNPAFLTHTAMPWPVGRTATELLGQPNPRWTELYGQVLETGRPIRVEESEATLDRIFDLNIFTLDSERNRVAVLFTNITERRRAETALRESETLRRVALDSGGMGAWTWDTRANTVRADAVVQRLWGVSTEEQPHAVSLYTELMYPEGAAWLSAVATAAAANITSGEDFHTQLQVSGGSATGRWVELRGRAEQDRPWIINGVSFDITELKVAARRLEVLVNELQHRSRNLLGVVTAMANRTVGRGSSAESFLVRLKALSRAQALLSQGGSDTVAVEALVRAELAAHADNAPDRLVIAGPAVTLTSQQVQNFALALHELATNAVKYGALKDGTGHLSVTWELIPTGGGPHLALNWVETGVAVPPEAVTRRGYGRELIEQALAYALGGRTEYVLGEDGVRCRIELPIA
ncbi:PAS domain S-box protein [Methylorubrum sp. SB2]|uniref:PAS domain S-box protein n=1 Tax=Methylorubrum subtropicum TaxID=3138812 RepID=UPI00313DBF92